MCSVRKLNENQGEKLVMSTARTLIIELFSGQHDVPIEKIKKEVDREHTSRGGQLATKQTHPAADALQSLKSMGRANNLKQGFWSILSGVEEGLENVIEKPDRNVLIGTKNHSVYFAECEGFVKIGSANNVPKRLSYMQSSNPFEIKIIGTIGCDCPRKTNSQNASCSREDQIQSMFQSVKIRGEWFRYSNELRAYIKNHFDT